jgi:hypothetical protein
MNPEEDPKYLILFSMGLDFVQTVVLLFRSKAAFHTCSPLHEEFSCQDLPVIFKFSVPGFAHELDHDFVFAVPLPVGIGGVDVIGRYVRNITEKFPAASDRVNQSGTLIKGIKANVFEEVDPINLDHVHLGPELHFLDLLTVNNGP